MTTYGMLMFVVWFTIACIAVRNMTVTVEKAKKLNNYKRARNAKIMLVVLVFLLVTLWILNLILLKMAK